MCYNNHLVIQSTKISASDRTIFITLKSLGILKNWQRLQRKELLRFGFNSLNKNQLVFTSQNNTMHNPNKPRV